MTKTIIKLFFGITIIIFFGCEDHISTKRIYKANIPTYMSYKELRTTRGITEPQPLANMGKLYIKDQYLFIGEKNKGIHIFNNNDPGNPINIGFIEIPGNSDIAIKYNSLYANSCIDLVVFDISDIENIKETGRIENIFSHFMPEHNSNYPIQGWDESKGVIVDFEEVELEEDYEYTQNARWGSSFVMYEDDVAFTSLNGSSTKEINASINPTGTGGSMARFLIHRDYLYTIVNWSLQPFDISDLDSPVAQEEIWMNHDVETLFKRKDKLFIGSTTGMLIYDLAENPAQPKFMSELGHVSSCDPVVVEGDYAYVTLRSGTRCQGFSNQLDIIDISNLYAPELVTSYPMTNPHGLGIDDGILFLCDGDDGLKIFDANDIMAIDQHLLYHFKDIHAYDVIPTGSILIMIGNDGILQYDYSKISELNLLSTIKINN